MHGDFRGMGDAAYFSYYSMLTHQQNMLEDNERTGKYYSAISENPNDFKDKVVLDVGAGSGILSLFAAKAGAKKVYAVEASGITDLTRSLVRNNGFEDVIEVIQGKMEQVVLPEMVDVIISEPIGVLLVHERMIESFLFARDKWLKKPDVANFSGFQPSQMYPSKGDIVLSPFTDYSLYQQTIEKANFWKNESFFNVALSGLTNEAVAHHFSQVVVGTFDPSTLISEPITHSIDFSQISTQSLQDFVVPLSFEAHCTTLVHGLAGWFDLDFLGSEKRFKLSTSPACVPTHWHQLRLLLKMPIAVNCGQVLEGTLCFKANSERSYDLDLTLNLKETEIRTANTFKLQHQRYSYL